MLIAYMKAGYAPIIGCNSQAALKYAAFQLQMAVKYDTDDTTILVNIGDDIMPMWVPSGYYWENEVLLRR